MSEHKGRFEVERLDKGFKVSVYLEKENQSKDTMAMYPEMERLEAATNSAEEVHKWIGQFLEHQKLDFGKPEGSEVSKPKGSLLTTAGNEGSHGGYAE